MTVFKSTDGLAIGQPISPFFGAQNGVQGAGAPTVQLPAGMPLLVAASLGLVPANCLVNTVNSVSVGGNIGANAGGDPCSVMELLSSGNGNQANGGVGIAPVPLQQGENQQYVVGQTALAASANGPTPVNVDPLGLAPVPGGLPCNSIGLQASGFTG
jgi:hypothetical protein